MSSFDIATITPEINKVIRGAWIDNIYQSNHSTILLKFRQPGKSPINLLIESGRRLHITSYIVEKPLKPPIFCMALRKYLKNGKAVEIIQHEFERTVVISVNTKSGEFKLVSELFGVGNVILVSPEDRILHALHYRKMRDRSIWRNEIFQFAPSKGKNPLKLNRQDLSEIKNFGQQEIVRVLTKILSIGGLYAEEILLRAQIDKKMPCELISEQEIDRLFKHLRHIISSISVGNIKPNIVFDDEKGWIDVTPISLKKHLGLKQKLFKTFNEALDDFYTNTSSNPKVVDVEQELARQKRILQSQLKAQKVQKEKIKQNKKIGDTIYLHFNELQFLLQKIMDGKKNGKSWKQITFNILKEKEEGKIPAVYFHSLEPENRIFNICIKNLNFSLALHLSIQTSANDYYSIAKKARKKLEGVKKAIRKTQINIEEPQRQWIELIKEKDELPRKKRKEAWYEKFRWFHSSNGFLVIGGRDATTNEIIIKRYMEPYDKVFHANIHGAPFVLIKTEGKIPPDQTMNEAAKFAASYSRAWKERLGSVDVYEFSPQQVSKSPPSGQHLKKGSFIISGQKKSFRNVPLRIAVGIKWDKKYLIVIGGPTETIANQTNNYVEIIPGEQKSGRLAKQIRGLLAKRAPENLKKQILRISLEEIQKFTPGGRGKIS
jgi:predicted ribosome quality control (RQC) complex YloA/Tae2 family protein